MIIRIKPGGKSFKGLGQYLTHDPGKAKTAERVDWTHTLNLANDHVPSAINEMVWTCRAADQLKREAGLATGGRRLQSPVKHISLNWHPAEQPTREEMIIAVQDYMKHMGWQDHHAVLVAHRDKHYKHVHVMVNAVSPVDGRALNTSYEFNRSSAWGLEYERSRLAIHCEQRLKPYEEREPAPTRETWMKMKEAEQRFEKEEVARATKAPEYFERRDEATWQDKEWKALKSHQRDVRDNFFVEGKQVFRELRSQVFREIRSEYRADWKAYFDLKRKGMDANPLSILKTAILERQRVELAARRDAACAGLRGDRDADYQQILLKQKMGRDELKARQAQGIRSPHLLDAIHEHRGERARQDRKADSRDGLTKEFRGAAKEVSRRAAEKQEKQRKAPAPFKRKSKEHFKVREPAGAAGGLGLGAIGGLATIAERLMDGFFGGAHPKQRAPAPPAPVKQEPVNDNSAPAADLDQRARDSEAVEAARLYDFWQERKRQRSRDRD